MRLYERTGTGLLVEQRRYFMGFRPMAGESPRLRVRPKAKRRPWADRAVPATCCSTTRISILREQSRVPRPMNPYSIRSSGTATPNRARRALKIIQGSASSRRYQNSNGSENASLRRRTGVSGRIGRLMSTATRPSQASASTAATPSAAFCATLAASTSRAVPHSSK
jgi:hypothetical protein